MRWNGLHEQVATIATNKRWLAMMWMWICFRFNFFMWLALDMWFVWAVGGCFLFCFMPVKSTFFPPTLNAASAYNHHIWYVFECECVGAIVCMCVRCPITNSSKFDVISIHIWEYTTNPYHTNVPFYAYITVEHKSKKQNRDYYILLRGTATAPTTNKPINSVWCLVGGLSKEAYVFTSWARKVFQIFRSIFCLYENLVRILG